MRVKENDATDIISKRLIYGESSKKEVELVIQFQLH